MFVQRVALDPVPSYAVVESEALVAVLRALTDDGDLRARLDAVYRRLEREQPALADFVSDELAQVDGGAAQALSYFLFLLVYLAFEQSFRSRLQRLQLEDLRDAIDCLLTDGEVREAHCDDRSFSEDAVAQGQPALMTLVRDELDRAGDSMPSADAVFEALLVEIIALTRAVAPVC